MRALVYNGKGKIDVEDRPKPQIKNTTDAVVRLTRTTICGTDLHIIKGDVPIVPIGRILGHEGLGIVDSIGGGVKDFREGDHVVISCITSCGSCSFCVRQLASFCKTGGWCLGRTIDGTQAEYVRIPHADGSLHHVPKSADERGLLIVSDILPTGLEVGVQRGGVRPDSTVAIIGAGPVGLAALIAAKLYNPSVVVVVDTDDKRLEIAKKMGATCAINPTTGSGDLKELTKAYHGDIDGFDVVIEAVGSPATFKSCQELVGKGGAIANVGVHGAAVDLHLESLWERDIRKLSTV